MTAGRRFMDGAARLALWPHRVAAVVVTAVLLYPRRSGPTPGFWFMEAIGLFPLVLLEGLGRRLSRTGPRLVFLAGSLCVCAFLLFYAAPTRPAGEYSGLIFVFVPVYQTAAAIVLWLVLAPFRTSDKPRSNGEFGEGSNRP